MSKEMLDAFRILEEDKGIKKEDITGDGMAKPRVLLSSLMKRLVTSVFIPFVK